MAKSLFAQKAPLLMAKFLADLPLKGDPLNAAAILGNIGHESGGLATLQESKPAVNGSRGGYGWPQWTAKRRVAYEAWCKSNGLSAASDEANYGYMLVELRGAYKSAIARMVAAGSLETKVKAFELVYEGAGVKHYDSRNSYARQALALYSKVPAAPPVPLAQPAADNITSQPIVVPATDKPAVTSKGDSELVETVQQLLRDKGFPEVGDVDGKLGTRTLTTIKTFQSYIDVEETGSIDDALLAQLVKYPGRPQSADRTNATAADLKDQAPVKIGDKLKTVGASVLSFCGLGGLTKGTLDLDSVQTSATSLKGISELIVGISPWLIGGAVGAVAMYFGGKIIAEFVEGYREGRHV